MGFIYLITNTANKLKYIGQTTTTVKARWKSHKAQANVFIKKRAENPEKQSRNKLYAAIADIGIENFVIEQLEEVDDVLLNGAERNYIALLNTRWPDGYNSNSGGSSHRHPTSLALKAQLPKKKSEPKLKERLCHQGLVLPRYIYLSKKNSAPGYRVMYHPLCEHRSFTTANGDSLEKCKQLAIDFIQELELTGVKYIAPDTKIDEDLPVGIQKYRTGYRVAKFVGGKQRMKSFISTKLSDDEKLELAKTHLLKLETEGPIAKPARQGTNRGLPKGIHAMKGGGYNVTKRINGEIFNKAFSSKEFSDEENLIKAKAHLLELETNGPIAKTGRIEINSGLPKYIRRHTTGYVATRIIRGKPYRRSFTSKKNTDVENLAEAKKFIKSIEDNIDDDHVLEQLSKRRDLPAGIYRHPDGGYSAAKRINGKLSRKIFTSKKLSDEEKLAKAIQYLNDLTDNRDQRSETSVVIGDCATAQLLKV